MRCAEGLHEFIEARNCLPKLTTHIADFFTHHPTAYKVTLVVMHLFRAAMMVGFMFVPMPPVACIVIGLVGSVIYRLTVERNCAYKFALPSFAGSMAFMFALPAIISIINGAAFISAAMGVAAFASLIPLALYGAYIILTVSYDVDHASCSRAKVNIEPTHKPQVQITSKGVGRCGNVLSFWHR